MSLSKKTLKYLNKNCPCDLSGKTVVVTGANSGIGFKTAEILLYLSARVIMACRNIGKAEDAKNALLKDYPHAEIAIYKLDLARLKSIDAFVTELQENGEDIYCFINNAGVFRQPNKKTGDGLEMVAGTNFIGTYYLTEKIIPLMLNGKGQKCVINTVSVVYKNAKNYPDDIYCEKKYGNFKVYARSKLALVRYTEYLAEKYKDTDLKVFMTHPGISMTEISLNAYGKIIYKLAKALSFLFNSVEKSALGTAYVLSHKLQSGDLIGPSGLFNIAGYPKPNRINGKAFSYTQETVDFAADQTQKIIKGEI